MRGGRTWALAIVAAGCASSGRAPERAPPVATAQEVGEVARSASSWQDAMPVATAQADEAERAERRREEVARLKSSLERDAELAAEREVRDRESEQEEARRWLGCHPESAARLRFAAGSSELDAAGRAAVDRLVRRLQGEPEAHVIILGARRAEEGEESAGIDRRRAFAVRDALLARGAPHKQIVAAAEFRSPAGRRGEVEVVWVCDVCCLL